VKLFFGRKIKRQKIKKLSFSVTKTKTKFGRPLTCIHVLSCRACLQFIFHRLVYMMSVQAIRAGRIAHLRSRDALRLRALRLAPHTINKLFTDYCHC